MFMKRKKKIKKSSPDNLSSYDSDLEFLESIYQKLLGRGVDETGKAHFLSILKEGKSRVDVVLGIIESEEFKNKIIRENIRLLPIKNEKINQYRQTYDLEKKEKIWIFQAESAGDFDWLEAKIIENGYYEKPGVWSFGINEDKKLLADIVSDFKPDSVLDIGCSNGPVMKCLKDKGIDSEGVEISQMALEKAYPEIKDDIHFGDLLDVKLTRSFDMILGLDIFEHLNPNKLDQYISYMHRVLNEGGWAFCNIPAFGEDVVFGEIFKAYIKEWEEDIRKNRMFQTVHVDNYGYPVNGHIIGAGSEWWVEQFEKNGFKREVEIEKALHAKYDKIMKRISEARLAYYIFSKNASEEQRQSLMKSINS